MAKETEKPTALSLVATETIFLGLHEKAGEFTDEKTGKTITYHNIEISVSDIPESTSNTLLCYGSEACVIKIKAENAAFVFGYSDFESDFDPEKWIGKPIDVRYDKKGRVKSVVLLSV